MVEDYAYVGADLRGDLKLPLSEDDQWDDRGEKNTIPCIFVLRYISFFCILSDTKTYYVIV